MGENTELGEKIRKHFREWLVDILESFQGSQLPDVDFPSDVQDCCSRLSKYFYYFKDNDLTTQEYNDLAEIVVRRFLKAINPKEVRMMMAEDITVLLDDEKSSLWLSPLAVAERTSLAFERGKRLVDASYRDIARSLMQDAANNGDVHCAMYLIKNKIVGDATFDDSSCDWIREASQPVSTKSTSYNSGMLYVRWEDFRKAESILRKASDNGDIDSSMYLIRQTLLNAAVELIAGR